MPCLDILMAVAFLSCICFSVVTMCTHKSSGFRETKEAKQEYVSVPERNKKWAER